MSYRGIYLEDDLNGHRKSLASMTGALLCLKLRHRAPRTHDVGIAICIACDPDSHPPIGNGPAVVSIDASSRDG